MVNWLRPLEYFFYIPKLNICQTTGKEREEKKHPCLCYHSYNEVLSPPTPIN